MLPSPSASAQANPIASENQRPGTTDWIIATNDVSDPVQIVGFPSATSVGAGGRIDVHVSTSPARAFTATVYRLGYYGGTGGREVLEVPGSFNGVDRGLCVEDADLGLRDCRWPASFSVAIGNDWVSGAYLIKLTRAGDGTSSYVPFTVTDDRRADIVYQQPVTTWHAYNNYPDFEEDDEDRGRAFYPHLSNQTPLTGPYPGRRAVEVSLARPLPGNGAELLLKMEHDLIMFLEQYGYDVTYQTDLDTHSDPGRLHDARRPDAVVSGGHDEYWTDPMFNGFLAARDAGVDLAFFGANAAYWRISIGALDNGHLTMANYRGLKPNDNTHLFRQTPATAEQNLIGVQYWGFQEGSGDGTDAAAPFVATNTNHWIFGGTGLRDGDRVPGVIGVEVDRWYGPGDPARVLGADDYTLIGRSPVTAVDEADNVTRERPAETVVYERTGATVFASATLRWTRALGGVVFGDQWRRCPIRRMTGNLLDRSVGWSDTVPRCDGATSWTIEPATVDESAGTAAVRVTLDPPATAPTSIRYATQPRTATGGSDFYGTSGVLNFAPGESTKTISVTIIDDAVAEATERFNVRLFDTGPDIASALVTIDDDDGGPLRITLDTGDVGEGDGTATATVRLSASQGSTVRVNLATERASAVNGADFYGLFEELTFAPGETVKRVPITIIDDGVAEPDEQFTVRIWGIDGETIATGTVGIRDDD